MYDSIKPTRYYYMPIRFVLQFVFFRGQPFFLGYAFLFFCLIPMLIITTFVITCSPALKIHENNPLR